MTQKIGKRSPKEWLRKLHIEYSQEERHGMPITFMDVQKFKRLRLKERIFGTSAHPTMISLYQMDLKALAENLFRSKTALRVLKPANRKSATGYLGQMLTHPS